MRFGGENGILDNIRAGVVVMSAVFRGAGVDGSPERTYDNAVADKIHLSVSGEIHVIAGGRGGVRRKMFDSFKPEGSEKYNDLVDIVDQHISFMDLYYLRKKFGEKSMPANLNKLIDEWLVYYFGSPYREQDCRKYLDDVRDADPSVPLVCKRLEECRKKKLQSLVKDLSLDNNLFAELETNNEFFVRNICDWERMVQSVEKVRNIKSVDDVLLKTKIGWREKLDDDKQAGETPDTVR